MKRICLFAGYDSKNIIHDYVVYYLKELSTVADVYYMADNEISEHEKSKIAPYVKGAYGFNHKKYDFGSWQELINILGWEKLAEYDELILTNDSIFGPVYPIKELFDKIEKDRQWEVFGISQGTYLYNNVRVRHIQSFFITIRIKHLYCYLQAFFSNIKIENSYINVVENCEVGFSKGLNENNVCVKILIKDNYDFYNNFRTALKLGSPFIKVKTILNGTHNYKNQDSFYNFESKLNKKYLYKTAMISDYMMIKNGFSLKEYNKPLYMFWGIINSIKQVRKKIIQIKFSKKRNIVVLFGISLYKRPKPYHII